MDRYWVGGSGNWDASTTTNWSATSGGASGASVPTSSDNVIFDAASNAVGYTVTVTATANCANIDFTNPASGALTFAGSSALNVFGNFAIHSAITFTYSGGITFSSTAIGKTINTNGVTLSTNLIFGGIGGGWSFSSDIDIGVKLIAINDGDVNSNNFNVSCGGFQSLSGRTRSLSFGSSVVTLTNSGNVWLCSTSSFTFNSGTSTVKLTNTSSSACSFSGGFTFYNLWFSRGSSTGSNTIPVSIAVPDSTFNEIRDDGTAAHSMIFVSSTNNTIASFVVSGSLGNLITIASSGAANHSLIKSGGGTVSCDYLSISKSTATPGSTWYAGANSTDGGSNSGWTFSAPPAAAQGNFFAIL